MSRKKPRFTLDQHRTIGTNLKRQRDDAMAVLLKVSEAYPKNHAATRRAYKLIGDFDALKCALDSSLFDDHPDQAKPSIYYGGDVEV